MIEFTCQSCGKLFRVVDSLAGKAGGCKQCGAPIRIPEAAPTAAVPIVMEEDDDSPPDAAPARPGGLVYKMVQIPPDIAIKDGTSAQGKAAAYLERVVNKHAADGWDFFRVDEIGVWVNPGCLGALFGVRPERVAYYVVTFRRPAGS